MKPLLVSTLLKILLTTLAIGAPQRTLAYGEIDPTFTSKSVSTASCNGAVAVVGDGSVYTTINFVASFGVARFRSDGTLDALWGSNGTVMVPEAPAGVFLPAALLPIPDGGIVGIGTHLVRWTRQGVIDLSFGDSGVSDKLRDDNGFYVEAFALQPDGSIVILTRNGNSGPGAQLTRIDSRGKRDGSFGVNGIYSLPFDSTNVAIYAWSLQADGSVEIGTFPRPSGPVRPALRRYPDFASVLDPSFRPGPRLVPKVGVASWLAPNVKVQPDGALLIAAAVCRDVNCTMPAVTVDRFGVDGNPDVSFGIDGQQLVSPYDSGPTLPIPLFPTLFPDSLWLAPAGQMTLMVHAEQTSGGFFPAHFEAGVRVYRLKSDGSLDSSFNNGKKIADGQQARLEQLSDGRLLQADTTSQGCSLKKLVTNTPRAEGMIVEYYHPKLDHYFMTLEGDETGFLDDNVEIMGWLRTGRTFGAWMPVDLPGASRVCRFYGDLIAGPNSHFFSPLGPECDGLRAQEAAALIGTRAWRLEALAFSVTPTVDGNCPPNLASVYRVYNRGFARGIDPNHRYTTDLALYDSMQSQGWVAEGVRFCASPPSFNDRLDLGW